MLEQYHIECLDCASDDANIEMDHVKGSSAQFFLISNCESARHGAQALALRYRQRKRGRDWPVVRLTCEKSWQKIFGGQHVRIAQYALARTVVEIVVVDDTKGLRRQSTPRNPLQVFSKLQELELLQQGN